MTDTILCVDIGTTSLKAALLPDNLAKNEIFVSRQYFSENAIIENRVSEEYLLALSAALRQLHEKNPDYAVEAICVSGNGPSVISDDGTTLLHNQIFISGSRGQMHGMTKEIKSALRATKSLFIPKFLGFKHNFPFSWKRSKHILGAPEFLICELTGEAVSVLPEERFLPAYWNDSELLNCGFSSADIKRLPPFVKAGEFVGKVSGRAALATGLLEGTLVFAGAPDFVVALVGTGTVFPGRLCDRAGSSEGLNLCTTKPVFAEGLRTMPSIVPGLWNLSYLLKSDTNYTNFTNYLDELKCGISLLREAACSSGEYFPNFMTITGGQALSDELIAQKEEATGLKIKKMPCADAELLGDLILARVSLGDYDDISEAVFAILGA